MKPTVKQLNAFIKDEKQGIKEYKKMGWNGLAASEAKHLRFLEYLKSRK